ncbi:MAG TPA: hypothetical protein VNK95_05245, partial [Caldilineaceae bacterium]|nr:hypothetical protein [Caldilineaceae bacterium]
LIPARDPLAPDAPQPDFFFLDAVCRHLQPRRLITTELHLRGPRYRDIWVSVGVQVVGGRAAGPVLAAVRQALRTFLSPLHGGRDGSGWPLETPVLQRELEAVAARVDGVRLVNELLLGTTGPTGVQLDNLTQVALGPLELPRVVAVEAATGAAAPLAQLRSAPSAPPPGATFAPIPVIPERC